MQKYTPREVKLEIGGASVKIQNMHSGTTVDIDDLYKWARKHNFNLVKVTDWYLGTDRFFEGFQILVKR